MVDKVHLDHEYLPVRDRFENVTSTSGCTLEGHDLAKWFIIHEHRQHEKVRGVNGNFFCNRVKGMKPIWTYCQKYTVMSK